MTVFFSARFADISLMDSKWNVTGDGVADDTSEIQSIINSAVAGQRIICPPGTYRTTSTLTGKPGVALVGYKGGGDETSDTTEVTTFKFEPVSAGDVFMDCTAAAAENSYEDWAPIEGIKVVGDGGDDTCFDWLAPTGLRVCDVRVEGFKHAFRLRDQINCLFDHVFVNSSSAAGSAAFLFDTKASFNGTTTTIRKSYLRLGENCILCKAASHSRIRCLDVLFESTTEGIADIEQAPADDSYWYFDNCESENVASNNSGSNQALFSIGVNGSGTGGVIAKFNNCQFAADTDTASVTDTRVLFDVNRGRVIATGIDVNGCGQGVIATASLTTEQSVLRDVYIANDEHPILAWGRGIDDFENIVIDHCGWTDFMTAPGRRCVQEHVDLSGASVDCSWTFTRFTVHRGWQTKVIDSPNVTWDLDITGGSSYSLKAGGATTDGQRNAAWTIGDPSANDYELNSSTATKYTFTPTSSTFSAGRISVVCYYDSLPNMSASA